MLANLLIKLLEHSGNILEGLFWLGIIIILFVFVSMLVMATAMILLVTLHV
jgi:hypothetical protein